MTPTKAVPDLTIDEMAAEFQSSNLYKRNPRRYGAVRQRLWDTLMLEWHGLVPYVGTGRDCPRRLVGKRCVAWYYPVGEKRCMCYMNPRYGRTVFDHFRMWRDKTTGNLVMTSEPYRNVASMSVDPVFIDFSQQCAEMGIDVTLSDRSPYGHPHLGTMLILLRARNAD